MPKTKFLNRTNNSKSYRKLTGKSKVIKEEIYYHKQLCVYKNFFRIKTYKYSNLGQDSSTFELIMLFELNIHDTDGNQAKASLTWDYIVDRVFLKKIWRQHFGKTLPPPPPN